MAKITRIFFTIGEDYWINERVKYLSCTERWYERHSDKHNAALNVALFYLFYPNALKNCKKVRNKEAKIKSSKDKNNKKGKRIF